MEYKIKGDSDCLIVEINLDRGKKVRIERGSMAYMSNTMIEGKMNGNKKGLSGALGALGRALTSGESVFIFISQDDPIRRSRLGMNCGCRQSHILYF